MYVFLKECMPKKYSSSYFTDTDETEGLCVAMVDDAWVNDPVQSLDYAELLDGSDTITLFGEKYSIIGTHSSNCAAVPFLSLPGDVSVDSFTLSFENAISRKSYDELKHRASEILPGKLNFPELPFPDEESIYIYNNIILASSIALNRLYPNVEAMMDSAFFLYDDMTEGETAQTLRNAAGLSPIITIQLSEMNANSKAYLREQLLQLLPIVVVLLILVIVSSVSVSAISARQRLNDYAKFYILGLRWKQCAAVSLFQSLVISIVLLAAAKLTPLSDVIMIIINPWLLLALPGILALYLAFSMIMPLLMIGTTTPKQLLQEQSGG